MTDDKPSVQQKERRLRPRFQIPKSQDAKVTLWAQQGTGDAQNETPEQCWQGCLGNICDRGLQVILEAVCWVQLRPNQRVKLQFDISSSQIEIKTEATGQVRYVLADEQDNRIKLGIGFLESELCADTKQAIHQVCEVVGFCPEYTFNKCPNL